MKKCRGFEAYKGIAKPKCNKGKGCDACIAKFQEVCHHPEKLTNFNPVVIVCRRCGKVIAQDDSPIINELMQRILVLEDMLVDLRSDVTTEFGW